MWQRVRSADRRQLQANSAWTGPQETAARISEMVTPITVNATTSHTLAAEGQVAVVLPSTGSKWMTVGESLAGRPVSW